MKLLSWMQRTFQGTRVNPCKEPCNVVTEESVKRNAGEKLEEPGAHYFLIRRKNTDDEWIPLKIFSASEKEAIADQKERQRQIRSFQTDLKKSKLPLPGFSCFNQPGVDEARPVSTFIEDQLGLLAIGTFGLKGFADGDLGDLEGFEMVVGGSEKDLRSQLGIPQPGKDARPLEESPTKQYLEIGEGFCAQRSRRNSPVFGENSAGELQVFGGYCWESRSISEPGGLEEEGDADGKREEMKIDATHATQAAKLEDGVSRREGAIVIRHGDSMFSLESFLDLGVPPSLFRRGSEKKLFHRIARFLGTKKGRSKSELQPPNGDCKPVVTVKTKTGEVSEPTKTTNSPGFMQKLFRMRSKSSTVIKPLVRLHEQATNSSKHMEQEDREGNRKPCTNVGFTCGSHHSRRKRSGRPQLKELFHEDNTDNTDEITSEEFLSASSQDTKTAQQGAGQTVCEGPSLLESCKVIEQSPEMHSFDDLTIDWADSDDEFASDHSGFDDHFELNQEQWLENDSEYFVLEL